MSYSVIISSVGRKDFVKDLLDSILSQTVPPGEILFFLDDNAECLRLADYLCDFDNCIKVYFFDSFNLPQKRNQAASLSSFDILLFSDDDDVWSLNRAHVVLNAIKQGAHVVAHDFSVFGALNRTGLRRIGLNSRFLTSSDLIYSSNVYGGGSGIACLKTVLTLFPFDATLRSSEDFDWWVRILLANLKVWYEADDLVSYRRHRSNMTGRILTMSRFSLIVQSRKLTIGLILLFSSIHGSIRIFLRFIISLPALLNNILRRL